MKRYFVFNCIIFCSMFLFSCMGFKAGGVKSGSSLYETFYVGEDGTQYFIKPLSFTGKNGDDIKLDFTLRYKDQIKDSAIINLSFVTSENFNKVETISIQNDNVTTTLNNISFIFSERDNVKYNCRFTTRISLMELNKLFKNSNWNILSNRNQSSESYVATKATKSKIDKLDKKIFSIFLN